MNWIFTPVFPKITYTTLILYIMVSIVPVSAQLSVNNHDFLPIQNNEKVSTSADADTTVTVLVDEEIEEMDRIVAAGIQYDTSFVGRKLRKLRRLDQKLTIFGYYRFFGYGRNISDPYPGLEPYKKAYNVGDGYREPMMSMTVLGRPNGKTTFATEIFMFTPYVGGDIDDNVISTNLGLNFYGNIRTDHGNFGIRAGGIHWYNLSPFTIGIYQILDRYSIFDRTPWEGVMNTEKYSNYFNTGATNPGDLRWNNQAFQGFILNGGKLPGEMNFDLFWGKTQPNGGLPNGFTDGFESITPTLDYGVVPDYYGYAGDARFVSNYITGGKVGRAFGKNGHSLYYNLIHSYTALDSVNVLTTEGTTKMYSVPNRSFQVHSLAYNFDFPNIVKITGELGGGYYDSPTYDKKWGEALMLHAFLSPKLTKVPIDIQLYQISKNFYNPNGAIATNSNAAIINDIGLAAGANGAGGQLAQVNQLVHNRRGVNINVGFDVNEFAKFNLGWGLGQEIDPEATEITFVHRINGLALSRIYNPFPANATGPTVFGPYARKISFFRGVTEIVPTTDLNPATAEALNKKYFAAVDLQAKFKASFLDRNLYFFYLGSFGGASAAADPLPVYNDDTYLFVQYHEFDLYYELFPKFILTGYVGLENARGGKFTNYGDLVNETTMEATPLPLDQTGRAFGVGFDYKISKSTGIYFRQRWMKFEDKNFVNDHFKGREATLELKTFF